MRTARRMCNDIAGAYARMQVSQTPAWAQNDDRIATSAGIAALAADSLVEVMRCNGDAGLRLEGRTGEVRWGGDDVATRESAIAALAGCWQVCVCV